MEQLSVTSPNDLHTISSWDNEINRMKEALQESIVVWMACQEPERDGYEGVPASMEAIEELPPEKSTPYIDY